MKTCLLTSPPSPLPMLASIHSKKILLSKIIKTKYMYQILYKGQKIQFKSKISLMRVAISKMEQKELNHRKAKTQGLEMHFRKNFFGYHEFSTIRRRPTVRNRFFFHVHFILLLLYSFIFLWIFFYNFFL